MKIKEALENMNINGLEAEGGMFRNAADAGMCGFVMSFSGDEETENVLAELKKGIEIIALAAASAPGIGGPSWRAMRRAQGVYKGIRLAYEKVLYSDVFSEEEWERLCALRRKHCFREIVRVTPESEYSARVGVTSVEDFVGKVVKPDVWVVGNNVVEMGDKVWDDIRISDEDGCPDCSEDCEDCDKCCG